MKRKNPISLDEAAIVIEAKRWPQPKKESVRERIEREAYNYGISEALEALASCKRLTYRRRWCRKKP